MTRGVTGFFFEQNTEYVSFVYWQGLDVLGIMRNIHVFVAKYSYNLNNQVHFSYKQLRFFATQGLVYSV